MKTEGWPTYSFTECLRPPDGWETRHAILSTYSADLTVIVTALLALSGCEFDLQRTGTRIDRCRGCLGEARESAFALGEGHHGATGGADLGMPSGSRSGTH